MTLTVTPAFNTLYPKLADFIAGILPTVPSAPPVIQMPNNRTSMPPPVPGFVGMTARVQRRLATNFEAWTRDPMVPPTEVAKLQPIAVAIQLDFYGADSNDWAVMFSTVFRDEYGCEQLAPLMAPLYCDDPRFAPLDNGEEEYESRWIVTAYVQYNPVTSTPQQFADSLEATLINVDVEYPP